MLSRLTLACTFALSVGSLTAQPVPAPPGWAVSRSGANWVYTPSNLQSGKAFTLTIEPAQSLGGQDVDQWLVARARADASRRGTLSGTPTTQHGIVTLGYRDSQGAQWLALYTAMPQPGTVLTNLPADQATSYVRTAGAIIGTMSKAAAPVENPAPIGNGPIVAVLHEGRGTTTVNGFQYIESADLLLKDGWAYVGLTTPPELLDEAASKQREPTKWHRWKSAGNAVLIETGGQWTTLEAERVRPVPPGAALNISLIHRHSTSFGGMGSYNTSQMITFVSGGRYQRSAGVIAGTGAVQAAGGFTGGAASFQNQNERRSSSGGGNGSVTATSQSRGQGDPNLAGTYKVNGYTLELDGAGGAVQRVIVFYPFSNDTTVYIDGVTYNRTH